MKLIEQIEKELKDKPNDFQIVVSVGEVREMINDIKYSKEDIY